MNILIVTQAVDSGSSTLGFFVEWLREFSKQCGRVEVIALSVGAHDLPPNVHVVSMGKERGAGKIARLRRLWKGMRAALPQVDAVFIHMCPEYLIAGWPILALRRKPVFLWYAHRQNSLRLRLAARLADVIGTIGPGSFPFATPKLRAMGHGIPTERFKPRPEARMPGRLVAVGRITPIKRLELLIEALAVMRKKGIPATLDLWGEPIMEEDRTYKRGLERLIAERGLGDAVVFRGAASYERMPEIDATAAVALNAAPTGALDKAVLEAMACGTPVVVCNRNFAPLLGRDADRCLADDAPEAVAAKIEALLAQPEAALGTRLRAAVEDGHSLARLISRILRTYDGACA